MVGGGGKSTLATTIANANGTAYLELDSLFWKPNWGNYEDDEFRARVTDALQRANDGWVCDGNYLRKLDDLVVGQADTVIVVNMPWRVMFWRVSLRAIGLAINGRMICGGNRQTWSHLLSSDSLLLWHIKHRKKYLGRSKQVREVTPNSTRLIQLDTPRQLDEFYAQLGLSRS